MSKKKRKINWNNLPPEEQAKREQQRANSLAQRNERRNEINRLCPKGIARLFGPGTQPEWVYNAMIQNGETEPLDSATVKNWLSGKVAAPSWVRFLQHKTAVKNFKNEVLQLMTTEKRMQEEILETGKLLGRAREKKGWIGPWWDNPNDYHNASDELDQAQYDLIRFGQISFSSAMICDFFGVNPRDHSTWKYHGWNCDGKGTDCASRSDEIEEESRELQRLERQRQSAENAAMLASGNFEVGQIVSMWGTMGVIVKHNKVSAKVRVPGTASNKWQLNEKSIKPFFLTPFKKDFISPEVGLQFPFHCPDGHDRIVTVVGNDGPFVNLEYELKSRKEKRDIWTDIGKIPVVRENGFVTRGIVPLGELSIKKHLTTQLSADIHLFIESKQESDSNSAQDIADKIS